jgi:short-subunit dehydrogenase
VDVTDGPAMDAWIAALDATSPMDLVIANAGVTTDTTGETGDADRLAAITEVNVNGVWHTLAPAIPLMQARGRGQIALMSSVAAYRGLPSAPAYSASKAWVKALGEALRGTLYGDGITVSVICPGFVESRITATNPFPMPLFMDARRAAGIIKRGLTRGKALIAFPWRLHALLWLLAALPPGLTDPLFRKMPRKE